MFKRICVSLALSCSVVLVASCTKDSGTGQADPPTNSVAADTLILHVEGMTERLGLT